jgi:hypothetical protein
MRSKNYRFRDGEKYNFMRGMLVLGGSSCLRLVWLNSCQDSGTLAACSTRSGPRAANQFLDSLFNKLTATLHT